jgi:hypothetical protein
MITPTHEIAEGVGGRSKPIVYVLIGHQFTGLGEGHKFLLERCAL